MLKKGYEPSEELKKELQNHVKKMTAPYKYPRVIEFVDELPKTISGKIRRVELRERDSQKANTDAYRAPRPCLAGGARLKRSKRAWTGSFPGARCAFSPTSSTSSKT